MNLPEFSQMVRKGGVALVLAGMLTMAAACGGQGSESGGGAEAGATPSVSSEVQVTEEVAVAEEAASAETAPAEKKAPVVHAATSVRDPFVNPTVRGAAGPAPVKPATPPPTASAGGGAAVKPAGDKAAEDEEIVSPDIEVTGIVRSGSGYRAILTGAESSYIVGAGDKLGAYRVTSITARTVTLAFKGHTFTLKMEEEFGPGGVKGAGEKSEGK